MMQNPQMQAMLQQNPELRGLLNNPEIMRQSMNMARNPALMQEMMRNMDRSYANISSMPGGMDALRRMYTEVQEPMMEAASSSMREGLGLNQTTQHSTNDTANAGDGAGGSAIPNPWGGNTSGNTNGRNSSGNGGNTSGNTNGGNTANPFGGNTNNGGLPNLLQQMLSMNNTA